MVFLALLGVGRTRPPLGWDCHGSWGPPHWPCPVVPLRAPSAGPKCLGPRRAPSADGRRASVATGRPPRPELPPSRGRRPLEAALLFQPLLPTDRRRWPSRRDATEGERQQHHGDQVRPGWHRGHQSHPQRLLLGHEQKGESLRDERVRPQLPIPGADRGKRLQHVRLLPLASQRAAHVPLPQRQGRPTLGGQDVAPAPFHTLPSCAGLFGGQMRRAPSI